MTLQSYQTKLNKAYNKPELELTSVDVCLIQLFEKMPALSRLEDIDKTDFSKSLEGYENNRAGWFGSIARLISCNRILTRIIDSANDLRSDKLRLPSAVIQLKREKPTRSRSWFKNSSTSS